MYSPKELKIKVKTCKRSLNNSLNKNEVNEIFTRLQTQKLKNFKKKITVAETNIK